MGNIVILGPRSSGKTTYLAALAYWPQRLAGLNKRSLFEVEPIGDDAKNLRDKAENIILGSASLDPTRIEENQSVDDLPVYQFIVRAKRRFKTAEDINLVVRDYAGEIFDELHTGNSTTQHQEFLEECLRKDVVGCLILLSNWSSADDHFYSKALDAFIQLMDTNGRIPDYRLAVAVSKCERGELWPGRLEPEVDLFGGHLRQTKHILQSRIPKKNLFFASISTFGVIKRNDPRPNRIDQPGGGNKVVSVLRKPTVWKPYSMISPLYWLSTGRRLNSDV